MTQRIEESEKKIDAERALTPDKLTHHYDRRDLKGLSNDPGAAAVMILAAEDAKPTAFIEYDKITNVNDLKETAKNMGMTAELVPGGLVVSRDSEKTKELSDLLSKYQTSGLNDEQLKRMGGLLGYPPADAEALAKTPNIHVVGLSEEERKRNLEKLVGPLTPKNLVDAYGNPIPASALNKPDSFADQLRSQDRETIETVGGFTFHTPASATSETTKEQAREYRDLLERVAPEVAEKLKDEARSKYPNFSARLQSKWETEQREEEERYNAGFRYKAEYADGKKKWFVEEPSDRDVKGAKEVSEVRPPERTMQDREEEERQRRLEEAARKKKEDEAKGA